MRIMKWLASCALAWSVACVSAPVLAADIKISAMPAATLPDDGIKLSGVQGTGCATGVSPCSNVVVTTGNLAGYLAGQSSFTAAYQPLDGDLTSLAAAASTNVIYYRSAASTWSPVTIGGGISFSGGTLATSGLLTTANNLSDVTSAATARTNLGLAIGTNVQAYNAALGQIAGLSPADGDFIERISGAWFNRTAAQVKQDLGLGYVLCKSAVASSITGSTTETTLATCTIPANAIGPNGQIEIQALWTTTNSANTKTLRIKFGSAGYFATGVTSIATAQTITRIANRNATNSQVGGPSASFGPSGSSTSAAVTSAIDTTSAVSLTFTGQLGNTSETITLESYVVRLTYGS